MKLRAALVIPFVALFAACSDTSSGSDASPTTDVITDASPSTDALADTSPTDTSPSDVARPDIATTDVITDASPSTDTSPIDTSPADASRPDVTADASPADVSTADVAPSDGGCVRPDVAVLSSRTSCEGGAACPTGYTCMSLSGVVLQRFCGRACRVDCDCPATQSCGSYADKAGTHPLCVSP